MVASVTKLRSSEALTGGWILSWGKETKLLLHHHYNRSSMEGMEEAFSNKLDPHFSVILGLLHNCKVQNQRSIVCCFSFINVFGSFNRGRKLGIAFWNIVLSHNGSLRWSIVWISSVTTYLISLIDNDDLCLSRLRNKKDDLPNIINVKFVSKSTVTSVWYWSSNASHK